MNRALFLDRDGVINQDTSYVHSVEDFHFIRGIFDLARGARKLGYVLVVVSNQAGVARGYYDEEALQRLNQWMLEQFEREGAPIAKAYYCPYHPNAGVGRYRKDSDWRKPQPGMILQAARDLDISLKASVLVGDKESDLLAAQAAGVGAGVLLGSETCVAFPNCPRFSSLDEVTRWLVERG